MARDPGRRLKIGVASLFTTEIEELNSVTRPSKIAYCERWGYTFLEHQGLLCPRPASWSKLVWLQQNLAKFDWLWWIDADAAIRNPALPLEPLLDERHEFIVARESLGNAEGYQMANLGSFFVRNTPWAHAFLQLIFDQEELIDDFYWEQAAFNSLYRQRPELRDHIRIDVNERGYNSFASSYRKGDRVFHAIIPFGNLQEKSALLAQVAAEDEQINFAIEPEITPMLVVREQLAANLFKHAATSLGGKPPATRSPEMVILNLPEREALVGNNWTAAHQYWFEMVGSALLEKPGELLLLVNQPVLFVRQWQRALLLCLRTAEIAFSHWEGRPDARLILFRNSPQVLHFWDRLGACFASLPPAESGAAGALEHFFASHLPALLKETPIRHAVLDSPAITSQGVKELGLDASVIKLQLARPGATPTETTKNFEALLKFNQQFSDAMIQKCLHTRRPVENGA